jgi:hypothetical protein
MIVSSDMLITVAFVCEYSVYRLAFTSSQHRHNGHYIAHTPRSLPSLQ